MVSSEMDALLNSSPFAEPYPVSGAAIEAASEEGAAEWSQELDHLLTFFTRKYSFDWARCSAALKAYARHVIMGVDGSAPPSDASLAPEACRYV
jgi:hypothetical protein